MRLVGISLGIGVVLVLMLPALAQAGVMSASAAPASPSVTNVQGAWAGYYVDTRHPHSVTAVEGSWIVPHLNASCKHHASSSLVLGIGMDYVPPYASDEQILTVATCASGSGARTYQTAIFDNGVVKPSVLKVAPGNVISASIVFTSGRLNYTVVNHNTSRLVWYHPSKSHSSLADRATAEWFATFLTSAPYQAPYGTLEFGPRYTHLNGTDRATTFGNNTAIGGHTRLFRTDIVRAPSTYIASTSLLFRDKASFSVKWLGY